MKRFRRRLFAGLVMGVLMFTSASAYDFRELELQGDLTGVTEYVGQMLEAERGGANPYTMTGLNYEDAVLISYIEMASWKDFLQYAAQGTWEVPSAEREMWVVPVFESDTESEVAFLQEPIENITQESGYSTRTTKTEAFDFVFHRTELDDLLVENDLGECQELYIFSILNDGANFVVARQGQDAYMIPYTGCPDLWGVQNKTVYAAEDFYAAAAGYIENALTPHDFTGGGGAGGGTKNSVLPETLFVGALLLGGAYIWKRRKLR